MSVQGKRLTIVQYAGDFREAAERLAAGGVETYRGQRYTVDYVEELAGRLASVTTITGFTDTAYDVLLPSGGRAIGAGFKDRFDAAAVVRLVEETKPDLLVLRTPSRPLMRWAIRRKVRTLMLLADSFNQPTLKSRIARGLMAFSLRSPIFDVVANHGRRAAEDLVAAGIAPAKVLAWDYPAFDSPADRPVKKAAGPDLSILYVGLLSFEKGVGDLIEAVAAVRDKGQPIRLDLFGQGEEARVRALVASLGLDDVVHLRGLIPNKEVIAAMAQADLVVVPSRHSYPEGMPLTIYEAYCSRTPLIVSDHAMFAGNVTHEQSGLIFRSGEAADLAAQILRLAGDPALYERLSAGGADAWANLQIPVKWHELIDRWIKDGPDDRHWIRTHSLAQA